MYHGSGISDLTKGLQGFLRDLDHCAIYFLIAGTYTPLTLINLIHNNLHPNHDAKKHTIHLDKSVVKIGCGVLIVVWAICIAGVSSKLLNVSCDSWQCILMVVWLFISHCSWVCYLSHNLIGF